jgi:ribosome-associated translation inhibitor RaiA
MTIEVNHSDRHTRDVLREYVRLRIVSVFDHLARQTDAVAVSLGDAPDRHGGVDTKCRMLARLRPSGAVQVEEVSSSLYAAIDRAAEKLAVAAAAELDRVAHPPGSVRAGFHPARVARGRA